VSEIRLYLAELLMNVQLWLAPKNKYGYRLIKFIKAYSEEVLNDRT